MGAIEQSNAIRDDPGFAAHAYSLGIPDGTWASLGIRDAILRCADYATLDPTISSGLAAALDRDRECRHCDHWLFLEQQSSGSEQCSRYSAFFHPKDHCDIHTCCSLDEVFSNCYAIEYASSSTLHNAEADH